MRPPALLICPALVAIVVALVGLGGCAAPAAPAGTSPESAEVRAARAAVERSGRAMVRTELIFRLLRDDGTVVTEQDWEEFVDQAVVGSFPGGFTALDAVTRGRDPAAGKVAERRAKVLLILHDPGNENLARIDKVCAQYRQRFGQQSIIRVSAPASVAF